jgi:hypothetical protein
MTNTGEFSYGFRLDLNAVKEKKMKGIYDYPQIEERFHVYSRYAVTPLSLFFIAEYNFRSYLMFELRPGIIMCGKDLSSYALELYCRYFPFDNYLFTEFGIENRLHIKPMDKEDINCNVCTKIDTHYDNEIHTDIALRLGVKASKKVSIDITYTKPFSEEYGYYEVIDEKNHFDLPDGKYPMKLYWMLRIGVNILLF